METVFTTVLSSLPKKRKNHNHTTPWGAQNKRVPGAEFYCTEMVTSGILKLCYIVKILFLVFGHCRIVIDLHVLCLHFLTFATLAAAAAAPAAEPCARGHHSVPWCHGVQGPWQEVPSTQHLGEAVWPAALHHIDDDDSDEQHHKGHGHAHQDLPAGHGQAEYGQGHHQEAKDEV